MNENKDFGWPEEYSDIFNTEPREEPDEVKAEETPDGVIPETAEEVSAALTEEKVEEITSDTAGPELEPSAYRGAGTGRKESPFADSPYVLHRDPVEFEQPCFRVSEPEIPAKKQKKEKKGLGRKLIAAAAALAVLAGSCGLTAHLVNRRWEQRFDELQEDILIQVESVRAQVNGLTPQSTGISVSGTSSQGGLTTSQVYAQNVHSVVLIESTVVSNIYGQTATGVASGSGSGVAGAAVTSGVRVGSMVTPLSAPIMSEISRTLCFMRLKSSLDILSGLSE